MYVVDKNEQSNQTIGSPINDQVMDKQVLVSDCNNQPDQKVHLLRSCNY